MRGNRLGGPARTTPIARATMLLRTSPKDAWGKAAGLEKMVPAGLGSWAARFGDVIVSALVVVNAIGDVRNARGDIIGGSVDSIRYLAEGGAPLGDPERLNRNTTLAVIATNADLDRVQLQTLAQSGSDALARRITPYGTLFDG